MPSGEAGGADPRFGRIVYPHVSPTELPDMMLEENFALVNTHVPFEGNIPGTGLSIPYDEIGHNLDRLPTSKEARIVLCTVPDAVGSGE